MPTVKDLLGRLLGLRGETPNETTAPKLAEDVFVLLAEKKTLSLPRKDLYNHIVLHVGVSKVDSIDALFQHAKSEATGMLSMLDFVEAATKRCRQMVAHQQQVATAQAAQKRAAAAAKLGEAKTPKLQVLQGSDRLNKLSKTNAFDVAVVTPATTKSMYQVYQQMGGSASEGVDFPHLKAYLSRTSPAMAAMAHSIFTSLDKDNRGRLSFPQILRMFYPESGPGDIQDICRMSGYSQEQGRAAEASGTAVLHRDAAAVMNEVVQVYQQVFDGDGDGHLDQEELTQALLLAGFSEEEAASMFSQVDTDKTGTVSFEEFREWYLKFAAADSIGKQQKQQGASGERIQSPRRGSGGRTEGRQAQ